MPLSILFTLDPIFSFFSPVLKSLIKPKKDVRKGGKALPTSRRKAILHAVFHRSLCLCQCKLYATQVELLKSCNGYEATWRPARIPLATPWGINTVNWQAFNLQPPNPPPKPAAVRFIHIHEPICKCAIYLLALMSFFFGPSMGLSQCLSVSLPPVRLSLSLTRSLGGPWVMANKLDMLTVCHCAGPGDRRPRNFMLKLIASILHRWSPPGRHERDGQWRAKGRQRVHMVRVDHGSYK